MLLRIVAMGYAALRVLLVIGLLRGKRHESDSRDTPLISIVVAAHNEAASLPTLLDTLLHQTYPRYEVIVVDDRSTDATPAVLRSYADQHDHLYVVTIDQPADQHTPKINALKHGVQAATGDLLLFTDADCRVPPTWAAGIAACFTPQVGAVLGYVDLRPTTGRWIEYLQAFDYFAMMATMAGAAGWGLIVGAAGANVAYRRATYDHVGGFDQLTGVVADDMVLVQRVLDQGTWRIVFCDDPKTFISTATEPNVKRVWRQRSRWMTGGQEVIRHNPALLVISSLLGTINGILLCTPLLWLRRDLRRAVIEGWLLRSLADLIHLGIAARRFRRLDLLPYAPLWIVVQLPYTLGLPLYNLVKRLVH